MPVLDMKRPEFILKACLASAILFSWKLYISTKKITFRLNMILHIVMYISNRTEVIVSASIIEIMDHYHVPKNVIILKSDE